MTDEKPLFCENTLRMTGRKCGAEASIESIRFGGPFYLCGRCALDEYMRGNKQAPQRSERPRPSV